MRAYNISDEIDPTVALVQRYLPHVRANVVQSNALAGNAGVPPPPGVIDLALLMLLHERAMKTLQAMNQIVAEHLNFINENANNWLMKARRHAAKHEPARFCPVPRCVSVLGPDSEDAEGRKSRPLRTHLEKEHPGFAVESEQLLYNIGHSCSLTAAVALVRDLIVGNEADPLAAMLRSRPEPSTTRQILSHLRLSRNTPLAPGAVLENIMNKSPSLMQFAVVNAIDIKCNTCKHESQEEHKRYACYCEGTTLTQEDAYAIDFSRTYPMESKCKQTGCTGDLHAKETATIKQHIFVELPGLVPGCGLAPVVSFKGFAFMLKGVTTLHTHDRNPPMEMNSSTNHAVTYLHVDNGWRHMDGTPSRIEGFAVLARYDLVGDRSEAQLVLERPARDWGSPARPTRVPASADIREPLRVQEIRDGAGYIKLASINCRSLSHAKAVTLLDRDFDIFAIQEIWQYDDATRAALLERDLQVVHETRPDGRGGVLLAASSKLTVTPLGSEVLDVEKPPGLEAVGLFVHDIDMRIICVYYPPVMEEHEPLTRWLRHQTRSCNTPVAFVGDFNARHTDWCRLAAQASGSNQARGRAIVRSELLVRAQGPTTPQGTTLDLVITTGDVELADWYAAPHAASPDHYLVEARIGNAAMVIAPAGAPRSRAAHKRVMVKHATPAHWEAFTEKVSTFIESSSVRTTPEGMHNLLVKAMLHSATASLPVRSNYAAKQHMLGMLRRRRRHQRELGRLKAANDLSGYRQEMVRYREAMTVRFRARVRKKTGTKLFELVRPREHRNAAQMPAPDVQAAHFADKHKYGAIDARRQIPTAPPVGPLTCAAVTLHEVEAALRKQKRSSARDPEGVDPAYLHHLPPNAIKLLRNLIDTVIRTGIVPSAWRRSVLIPLYKKGLRSDPKNYRPVALTSLLSRAFERVIVERVRRTIAKQFGYTRATDASAAIAKILQKIREEKGQKYKRNDLPTRPTRTRRAYAVLVDLTDAFARVSPESLLATLHDLGVDPAIARVIYAWLKQRSFRLAGQSTYYETEVGLPQGGALSPMLWLLFSSPLIKKLSDSKFRTVGSRSTFSDFVAYADDISLFAAGERDHQLKNGLQLWAKNITEFCEIEGIKVSTKTEVIRLGTGYAVADMNEFNTFSIAGHQIAVKDGTEAARLLGIHVNGDLNQRPHVDSLLDEFASILITLRSLEKYATPVQLRDLYSSLALGKAAHYAAAWWPFIPEEAKRELEIAHQQACRVISGATATCPGILAVMEAGLHTFSTIMERLSVYSEVKAESLTNDRLIAPARDYPYPADSTDVQHVRFMTSGDPTVTRDSDRGRKHADSLRRVDEAGPFDILVATDGATGEDPPAAAGAALIWRGGGYDRPPDVTIQERLADQSCSYACERRMTLTALEWLDDQLPTVGEGPLLAVQFRQDAKSVIDALAMGPLRQDDDECVAIWQRLLKLRGRATVTFIFVFAHCGVDVNEAADKAAGEAVETLTEFKKRITDHAGTADTTIGATTWWKDKARLTLRPTLRTEAEKVTTAAHGLRPSGLPTFVASSNLRGSGRYRLLGQLRTLVCPRLGGDREGRNDPCKACGRVIEARGGRMVAHVMEKCTAVAALRRRIAGPDGVIATRTLWDEPLTALRFVEAFMEHVSNGANGG